MCPAAWRSRTKRRSSDLCSGRKARTVLGVVAPVKQDRVDSLRRANILNVWERRKPFTQPQHHLPAQPQQRTESFWDLRSGRQHFAEIAGLVELPFDVAHRRQVHTLLRFKGLSSLTLSCQSSSATPGSPLTRDFMQRAPAENQKRLENGQMGMVPPDTNDTRFQRMPVAVSTFPVTSSCLRLRYFVRGGLRCRGRTNPSFGLPVESVNCENLRASRHRSGEPLEVNR